jgi:adenylate cyclase
MLGDDFVVRDLDKVVLLGTDRPAHFYQLLGKTGHVAEEVHQRISLFEQALTHYRHGEFEDAVPLFQMLIDEDSDDFAPQLFLNRMERLSKREQEREWDGIWVVRDPYERTEADG